MAGREVKVISYPRKRDWTAETPTERQKEKMRTDSEDENIKSLWINFTQSTGMHGVNHLGRSDRLIYKIRVFWWALAIAVMTAFMIYILVSAIREYYTFPKVTSYSVEVRESLNFPAVTICNFSPLNNSKINVTSNPQILNFLLANSPLYGLANEPKWDSNEFFDKDMTSEWYVNRAMNKSKMFYFCWFNRLFEPCDHMFDHIHTKLGDCYQFNGNVDQPKNVTLTGSTENLVVLVFVDQKNYVYALEPAAGVQVKIHDQKLHPDDESSEVIAGTGTTTYIQLSKAEYKFLPKPFVAFGNRECLDLKSKELNVSYESYNECIRKCFVQRVFEKCGCYRVADTEEGRRCSPRELTDCYLPNFRSVFENPDEVTSCNCLTPCEFGMYDKGVSTAVLPSDIWAEIFIARGYAPSMEYIKNNYLELRIFFGDMLVETFEQIPQYSLSDVLANFGGQMGLFLGASILTLTELGEFLVLVCLYCCRRRRNRATRVNTFR